MVTPSHPAIQYSALRDKLLEFPDTKFILFTGAAQVKSNLTEDEARRAQEFFTWVINEWDIPEDNIYLYGIFTAWKRKVICTSKTNMQYP